MANIKCIDVSTWQSNIDWKKVKAAGYGHAIIRAGFGRETTQVDNQFERNYKNAKAAGVKLGVYWYSYAVDKADAVKEANACLTVLKGKKLEMPVFFDMEESFMTKYSKSTLTGMAKAFCDTIKKAGFNSGVYSNLNWFTNYLDYNSLKKSYSIWLAQWSSAPQLTCDIWQYSSEGTVPGISGNVDMNIIYNDDIVKTEEIPIKPVSENFEIAAIQALLCMASELGIIEDNITVSNKPDEKTTSAILKTKTLLSLKENTEVSLEYIERLKKLIVAAFPIVGDADGDGEITVKDATEIQKIVAKVEK